MATTPQTPQTPKSMQPTSNNQLSSTGQTTQPPAPPPPKPSATNDQLFQEAREWFNNMNTDSRNQMILVLYKLCLSTRDISHEKLISSLNSQWNDKFGKQVEVSKRLAMENEVLAKNQSMGINLVIDKMNQLEHNIHNSVTDLSAKITPSTNGKLGEDYVDQILSKIPGSELINVTQSKGEGDFILKINNTSIMIESKNWTNSSIKANPKEIENFKRVALEGKENGTIDFAIMALHRVTDLSGKAIEMDMEVTSRGPLIILYTCNLFNNPERLLHAIDIGIFLFRQNSKTNLEKDKFLFQINSFFKSIDLIEASLKTRNKLIKDLVLLTKKDTDQLVALRQLLDEMIGNTERRSIKERVVDYYLELAKTNHSVVTKAMLESKCLEHRIPARWCRELGGIKAIRQMALERVPEGTIREAEAEVGSGSHSEISSESDDDQIDNNQIGNNQIDNNHTDHDQIDNNHNHIYHDHTDHDHTHDQIVQI